MPPPRSKQDPRNARPIPKHAPKGAVERHEKLKVERPRNVSPGPDRSATLPGKAQPRGTNQSEPDAPIG
jgi:hypothetical protein